MSTRSREARQLARELATQAGVDVAVLHDRGRRWLARWSDGLTSSQMRDLIETVLGTGEYPDMADREIRPVRTWSPRSWAARAVASRRDGRLEAAIAATLASWVGEPAADDSDLTARYRAVLRHVEAEVDDTPHPDRADHPEDETVIGQLLASSGGDRYRMAMSLARREP